MRRAGGGALHRVLRRPEGHVHGGTPLTTGRGAAALAAVLLLAACAGGERQDADVAEPRGDGEAIEAGGEDDEEEGGDDQEDAAASESDTAAGAALAPAPGFDGLTITVGILGPLTGGGAPVTGAVTAGHDAYWRHVNEHLGGVGARYGVEVRPVDARAGAERPYRRVRDDVTLFAHVADSVLDGGVAASLRRDGIVGLPGSRAARWTGAPSLLPVGVPEPAQIERAVGWLDGEGIDLPPACVTVTGPDPAEVVRAVTAAGCDAVLLRGGYPDTGEVLSAAAAVEAPARWVLLADGWAAPLASGVAGPYVEERVVVVQEETCAPDCVTDRGATGEELSDSWFRYGWTQARITHELLEEALEAGGLDRETLRAAMGRIAPPELDGVMPPWAYAGAGGRVAPTALAVYEVDLTAPGRLVAVG